MPWVLVGCVGVAPQPPPLDPIEVEPIGPILEGPDGRPPIECRGLPRDRCEGPGTAAVVGADVERVIVSCIGVCTSVHGEFRIDLVIDGRTELHGQGEWGTGP